MSQNPCGSLPCASPPILPPGAEAAAKAVPAEPTAPADKKKMPTPEKQDKKGTLPPSSKTSLEVPYGTTAEAPIFEEAPQPRALDESVTVSPPTALPMLEKAEQEAVASAVSAPIELKSQTSHAADYSWIVGKMEYLNSKNQWRVRYAAFDADDVYGGVIVLTGVEHLSSQFVEGMPVRVQGQLVHTDGAKPVTEYFVYEIKTTK